MSRDPETAKKWVIISAMVVAGIWAYRRWQEAKSAAVPWSQTMPGLLGAPQFFTAWAATFFVLSLVSEAAPRLGGSFAVLIMTGDVLTNGQKVIAEITAQQGKGVSAAASKAPAPATAPASAQPAGAAGVTAAGGAVAGVSEWFPTAPTQSGALGVMGGGNPNPAASGNIGPVGHG